MGKEWEERHRISKLHFRYPLHKLATPVAYPALIHLHNSLGLGRLPYIKMPTR